MEKTLIENHLVTKFGVVNLVFGIILLGFSIYAMFFSTLIEQSLGIILGIVFLWLIIVRLIKDLNHYHHQNAKIILIIELVIDLIAIYYLMFTDAAIARYLGVILYLRGFTYFLLLQVLKLRSHFDQFILSMIFITIGAYTLFTGNAFESELIYVLFALLVIYAGLFIYTGIILIKKKKTRRKS